MEDFKDNKVTTEETVNAGLAAANAEPAAAESADTANAEPAAAESADIANAEPAAAESADTANAEPAAAGSADTANAEPAAAEVQADVQETEKPAKKKIKKQKTRKRGWFFLRLAVFVAIMLVVLTYFIYVLTPKYQYGICSLMNYYRLPEDSVDVLVMGTSLAYTDMNTNILWQEYGIACYDLATAEQPFWSTYYYLVEAVKYQKPKLLIIDMKAITYLEDKVDRTRTVLCSFGLLNPVSRLKCIYECIEPEEFWGYALAFSQIHTNYLKTKGSDFVVPPDNGGRGSSWKGYLEKDEHADHDPPSINFSFATPSYVNEHESEYFRKILQFCVDNEINTLLMGFPNADYKHDHLYYCAASQIAEEYGIPVINYNLPENSTGINYHNDCADWQHLNVGGSVTFSRAVGQNLKDWYDLPDHRGDPAYASYDECAELWYSKFPQFRKARY